jgi:hypothetical protein
VEKTKNNRKNRIRIGVKGKKLSEIYKSKKIAGKEIVGKTKEKNGIIEKEV